MCRCLNIFVNVCFLQHVGCSRVHLFQTCVCSSMRLRVVACLVFDTCSGSHIPPRARTRLCSFFCHFPIVFSHCKRKRHQTVSKRKVFVRRLSFEYALTVHLKLLCCRDITPSLDSYLTHRCSRVYFLLPNTCVAYELFSDPIDSTMSDTLHRIFSVFGPIVEAAVIYDKHTKRSKGYGMIDSPLSALSVLVIAPCVVCDWPCLRLDACSADEISLSPSCRIVFCTCVA